jgi:hypothetical protein
MPLRASWPAGIAILVLYGESSVSENEQETGFLSELNFLLMRPFFLRARSLGDEGCCEGLR